MIEIEGFYLPGIITIVLLFLLDRCKGSDGVYLIGFLSIISTFISILFYGVLAVIWIYNNVRVV